MQIKTTHNWYRDMIIREIFIFWLLRTRSYCSKIWRCSSTERSLHRLVTWLSRFSKYCILFQFVENSKRARSWVIPVVSFMWLIQPKSIMERFFPHLIDLIKKDMATNYPNPVFSTRNIVMILKTQQSKHSKNDSPMQIFKIVIFIY